MQRDSFNIIEEYIASLKEDFHVYDHPHGCVIVTPYVRPDGDCIEVLVEENQQSISLTDMGDTLAYLHLNGLALSRRLMDDVRRISHRFGATIEINEIVISTDMSNVAPSLHNLVQAAINIAALVEKRRPHTNLRFEEEVEATIIAHGKRYDPQYEVPGEREPHTVRFHIDSGLNMLIQPFTQVSESPARSMAERWNYRFNDILSANPHWTIYALLDDRRDRQSIWANPRVIRPLEGLVRLVNWSDNREFLEALGGEIIVS